jgi:hypothetical protein
MFYAAFTQEVELRDALTQQSRTYKNSRNKFNILTFLSPPPFLPSARPQLLTPTPFQDVYPGPTLY